MCLLFHFLFTVTATTEIYTDGHTLSLHDALPIAGARLGLAHVGGLQPRRLRRGGELAAELAEDEVLRTALDETERGRIPEGRGAAVADEHLVALGHAEKLGQACAHTSDEVFHRRLAVRGSEDRRAPRDEGLQLRSADLGRAASEASVGGQQVARQIHVRHGSILGGMPPAPRPAAGRAPAALDRLDAHPSERRGTPT